MTKQFLLQAVALLVATSTLHAGSITGTVTSTGMRDNGGAVVYIERIEGKTFAPPKDSVLMDQRGTEFFPKVLPLLVGTTVEFLNSDPFSHNVFTPDKCAGRFNLGSWGTGEQRSHTFTEPCKTVILCNTHPEMEAYILVLETPYYAVTSSDGAFTILDLPDGNYSLRVWHPRLGETGQDVKVSGESRIALTLGPR